MAKIDDLLAKMNPPENARDRWGRKKRRRKPRTKKPEKTPSEAVCAFCGQTVAWGDTADTDLGRACKRHPGVG